MKMTLLALALSVMTVTPNFANAQPPGCDGTEGIIKKYQDLGLIMRHEDEWKKVYVSKDWYELITADAKENIVKILSKCFTKDGIFVRIYDGYSGKLVAENGVLGVYLY